MSDPVEVIAIWLWESPATLSPRSWALLHPDRKEEHRGMARALLSAMEEEGMVVGKGWKPIETAPKAGVIDLWADGLRWPDCYWVEGTTGYWTCQGVGPIDNPTHWMRLPEPPEPRP